MMPAASRTGRCSSSSASIRSTRRSTRWPMSPADVRENKRYKDIGDFSIEGLAKQIAADFGDQGLDILVHSLANGPEVKKALIDTSRAGYLAAVAVSAYSMVSLMSRLGPLMRRGGSAMSLTYLASERAVPFYGGGMSSAKAALESDTRMLAFEAGRTWGVRVNTISAGPVCLTRRERDRRRRPAREVLRHELATCPRN